MEERHDLLQIKLEKEKKNSKELAEQVRLLQNEVKEAQEEINNAYKRIAEYANKEYMKRLGESPVISGELIDVTT